MLDNTPPINEMSRIRVTNQVPHHGEELAGAVIRDTLKHPCTNNDGDSFSNFFSFSGSKPDDLYTHETRRDALFNYIQTANRAPMTLLSSFLFLACYPDASASDGFFGDYTQASEYVSYKPIQKDSTLPDSCTSDAHGMVYNDLSAIFHPYHQANDWGEHNGKPSKSKHCIGKMRSPSSSSLR